MKLKQNYKIKEKNPTSCPFLILNHSLKFVLAIYYPRKIFVPHNHRNVYSYFKLNLGPLQVVLLKETSLKKLYCAIIKVTFHSELEQN